MDLRRLLGLGSTRISVTDDDRRAALRGIIGRCPLCSDTLDGHQTYALATALASDKESVKRATHLLSTRDWSSLSAINEWRADSDVKTMMALRCPTGRLAIIAISFTAEMWSDDYVEGTEELCGQDRKSLEEFTLDRWETL